jgi:hypothetical protein
LINTEGRETFPFVNDDNEIYFASDGHPGLGGLDIFVSKINTDGTFGKVQNVGMDANSQRMILGIGLILNQEEVYHQTEMVDKVMMIFINSLETLCEQQLYGKVTDLATSEILQGKNQSV